MSKSIIAIVALGLVTVIGACSPQAPVEDVVFVEQPVIAEPVLTKY
jgi:hypothetical protein